MTGDVTFIQVSSAEHTTDVLLERFPLLGIYMFHYNILLVSNRMIDW